MLVNPQQIIGWDLSVLHWLSMISQKRPRGCHGDTIEDVNDHKWTISSIYLSIYIYMYIYIMWILYYMNIYKYIYKHIYMIASSLVNSHKWSNWYLTYHSIYYELFINYLWYKSLKINTVVCSYSRFAGFASLFWIWHDCCTAVLAASGAKDWGK